jgi:hypothetical protein
MKKLLIIIAAIFFNGAVFAQLNDVHKIFDKYQETECINSVRVSKQMFSILNKMDIHYEDLQKIKPLLANVNSVNILISGAGKLLDSLVDLGSFSVQQEPAPAGLQNEINAAVKKLNFEELVTINSSGRKIKLLTAGASGNILHTLLLSITGGEQNVLMLLDGDIPMADLSKFISDQQ